MRDIVFDLGGVLIDWDPRYLFGDHLAGDPGEVERFLATVCTPAWHARLDAGASFAAETAALAARHPDHAAWINRYGTDWPRMFRGPIAATVECLVHLEQQGFRLHALSNYPAEHLAFLYREFDFMKRFDTVVVSGLVGASKPDERIFHYLAARIRHRPCLFVDDRMENVDAARRCGLATVHFTREAGIARLLAAVGTADVQPR